MSFGIGITFANVDATDYIEDVNVAATSDKSTKNIIKNNKIIENTKNIQKQSPTTETIPPTTSLSNTTKTTAVYTPSKPLINTNQSPNQHASVRNSNHKNTVKTSKVTPVTTRAIALSLTRPPTVVAKSLSTQQYQSDISQGQQMPNGTVNIAQQNKQTTTVGDTALKGPTSTTVTTATTIGTANGATTVTGSTASITDSTTNTSPSLPQPLSSSKTVTPTGVSSSGWKKQQQSVGKKDNSKNSTIKYTNSNILNVDETYEMKLNDSENTLNNSIIHSNNSDNNNTTPRTYDSDNIKNTNTISTATTAAIITTTTPNDNPWNKNSLYNTNGNGSTLSQRGAIYNNRRADILFPDPNLKSTDSTQQGLDSNTSTTSINTINTGQYDDKYHRNSNNTSSNRRPQPRVGGFFSSALSNTPASAFLRSNKEASNNNTINNNSNTNEINNTTNIIQNHNIPNSIIPLQKEAKMRYEDIEMHEVETILEHRVIGMIKRTLQRPKDSNVHNEWYGGQIVRLSSQKERNFVDHIKVYMNDTIWDDYPFVEQNDLGIESQYSPREQLNRLPEIQKNIFDIGAIYEYSQRDILHSSEFSIYPQVYDIVSFSTYIHNPSDRIAAKNIEIQYHEHIVIPYEKQQLNNEIVPTTTSSGIQYMQVLPINSRMQQSINIRLQRYIGIISRIYIESKQIGIIDIVDPPPPKGCDEFIIYINDNICNYKQIQHIHEGSTVSFFLQPLDISKVPQYSIATSNITNINETIKMVASEILQLDKPSEYIGEIIQIDGIYTADEIVAEVQSILEDYSESKVELTPTMLKHLEEIVISWTEILTYYHRCANSIGIHLETEVVKNLFSLPNDTNVTRKESSVYVSNKQQRSSIQNSNSIQEKYIDDIESRKCRLPSPLSLFFTGYIQPKSQRVDATLPPLRHRQTVSNTTGKKVTRIKSELIPSETSEVIVTPEIQLSNNNNNNNTHLTTMRQRRLEEIRNQLYCPYSCIVDIQHEDPEQLDYDQEENTKIFITKNYKKQQEIFFEPILVNVQDTLPNVQSLNTKNKIIPSSNTIYVKGLDKYNNIYKQPSFTVLYDNLHKSGFMVGDVVYFDMKSLDNKIAINVMLDTAFIQQDIRSINIEELLMQKVGLYFYNDTNNLQNNDTSKVGTVEILSNTNNVKDNNLNYEKNIVNIPQQNVKDIITTNATRVENDKNNSINKNKIKRSKGRKNVYSRKDDISNTGQELPSKTIPTNETKQSMSSGVKQSMSSRVKQSIPSEVKQPIPTNETKPPIPKEAKQSKIRKRTKEKRETNNTRDQQLQSDKKK